jgi:hypothetical protein
MTKAEMLEIISLCSALDGQIVSEPKAVMWLAMFDGYSSAELQAGIIPALRESTSGLVTAKGLFDFVRRVRSQPVARGYVGELHGMGEHFECRPGEFGHPAAVEG